MDDSTAHAVLRILRELAANAVAHGKAANVRVACEDKGDILQFTVSDDGCGFDPSNCPGQNEGHFGLSGIRERVKRLEGSFEIKSAPGKGSIATVTLAKESTPS
jgi:signal transduction histidine kinase